MKAVNVRQLKNNPSEALREARKQPVVVVNRDQPEALLVHLDDQTLLAEPGVRRALATALYRDESLSLGQAARFAGVSIAEFMQHVSRLGIPIVRGTPASVREDEERIAQWRKGSSRRTRAR
jgi:antitoxin (DNA-binding transcriptional repressor) of toxin-antitoxin stability system